MSRGMLHLYTGDGKGKTTAALGLALRAEGRGIPVIWTSFLKDYDSGEFINPPFRLVRGRPFSGFLSEADETARAEARREASARLAEVFVLAEKERAGLLVLDEGATAVALGLIDEGALAALLDSRPPALEVVITGRGAGEALIRRADYITEMVCRKHPFSQGVPARTGIER